MAAVPKQLTPWPKGVCGNPGGRPSLPPELKAIKSLSQIECCKLVSKYARMSKLEVEECLLNPSIPAIELAIASIFIQAIKKGDFFRLGFLLDRAIGKVPEQMPSEDDDEQLNALRSLPMRELLTLVQKTLPEE